MSSSQSFSNPNPKDSQPLKPKSKGKGKKNDQNLAGGAGGANGSEIEPGAVPMETLKRKTAGFSLVEFLHNPRWVVTIQKKFHMEMIERISYVKLA